MGVYCTLFRVSSADYDWFRAANREAIGAKMEGWLSSDVASAFSLALEKEHAVMHFLPTGKEEGGRGPRSFICNEGLGEKMGYKFSCGPGRLLSPQSVQALNAELAS